MFGIPFFFFFSFFAGFHFWDSVLRWGLDQGRATVAGHWKDAKVSAGFGGPLRRPCHCRPRKPTCSLPGSRFSVSPVGCPIFLPLSGHDRFHSRAEAGRGRGCKQKVPPPNTRPSGRDSRGSTSWRERLSGVAVAPRWPRLRGSVPLDPAGVGGRLR